MKEGIPRASGVKKREERLALALNNFQVDKDELELVQPTTTEVGLGRALSLENVVNNSTELSELKEETWLALAEKFMS
jgi:hypothetical protein